MGCPSCLCSTSFDVTIQVGEGTRTYQECQYCGNLWSRDKDARDVVQMRCPVCIEATGINVVLPPDSRPPQITCRTCGSAWIVRPGKRSES